MDILKAPFQFTESITNTETKKSGDSRLDRRWKPSSLNPFVLASVTALTLFLVVLLAILQAKSNQDGGILFSENIDSFSAGTTFLYLYLPTIIAVIYTTVWNWVDLDVKRLEPWYQLSQEAGSNGNESILLQYPAEFLASVPISAMKRRQWAVFCSSLILVILFWGVTPLQSGIFAVSRVQKSTTLPMFSSPGLRPFEEQEQDLTLKFVNDGFDVAWLGQKLPAFTTTEYALAPFLPSEVPSLSGSNRTWTGNTVLYGTDLTCDPAAVSQAPHSDMLTFDDGRGCIARNLTPDIDEGYYGNITAYYVGFEGDGISLRNAGCNSNSLHEFLAIWRVGQADFRNTSSFSALFCWPEYFEQEVEATVRLPDYSVQGIRPLSEKKELSAKAFNYTLFEQLIVTGALNRKPEKSTSPQADSTNRRDISDRTAFDHSELLKKLKVTSSSNLVPVALGMSGSSPDALLQPSNLQNAFQKAHRMMFALAANAIMEPPIVTKTNNSGIVEASLGAVVMVEVFTFLVIGFLLLVAALSVYLLCVYRKRTLNLRTRPDSILSVMELTHGHDELLSVLRPLDRAKDAVIEKRLKDCHLKVQIQDGRSQVMMTSQSYTEDEDVSTETACQSEIRPWPWELRLFSGGSFISILIGSIVGTIVLQTLSQKRNGLSMPSDKAIVQQILLNYLPTALGTILEPFWVVLNRLLCILQPFFEMSTRTTSASKSILLEYTSVPPQLAFWRALAAKHWLLAIVCVVTAVANVLTVGLSGLFEIRDSTQETSILLKTNILPKFQPANLTDAPSGLLGQPLQLMLAHLSSNVPLPPWTSPEYYFIPFSLPPEEDTSVLSYSVPTIGIGSQLDCREMKESNSNLLFTWTLSHDAMQANFTASETLPDGTLIRCYSPNGMTGDNDPAPARETQVYLRGSPEGRKGVEMFIQPIPAYAFGTPQEKYACPRMLIAGWVRASITLGKVMSKTLYGPTANITSVSLDPTFMMCKPRFHTAQFNVTVDRRGYVLNYTRTSPLDENVDEELSGSIWNATTFLVGAPPDTFSWHNDTLTGDWINLFLKEWTNSTSIIDPNLPLPDFPTMADLVSKVYQELFAVVLQANQDWFSSSESEQSVDAKGYRKEQRIFLSGPMYKIVLIILILDVIVAFFIYIRLPKPFLHRMPTSIAALLPYGASSHLLQDLKEIDMDWNDVAKSFEEKGRVYGFGRHIGTDGEVHVGIERQPYLIPRHINKPNKFWRLTKASLLRNSSTTGSDMI